jgi:hypothetical protein
LYDDIRKDADSVADDCTTSGGGLLQEFAMAVDSGSSTAPNAQPGMKFHLSLVLPSATSADIISIDWTREWVGKASGTTGYYREIEIA